MLTRERIVSAALSIVDCDGLAALSMRRLGAALGVDPMAIYHHVPNKAALYDALVEAVMAEMRLPETEPEGPVVARLRTMAYAYRDALLAHPNAIPVVAARPVRTVGALRPVERMLGVLMEIGFSPRQAIAAVDVCGHFIMGSVQAYVPHMVNAPEHEHEEMPLDKLPRSEFPNLHRVMESAGSEYAIPYEFEFGLDALLRGLLATAGEDRPGR